MNIKAGRAKALEELSKHTTNTIARRRKKKQMSFMRSFIRFIAAMLCVVAGEFRDLSFSYFAEGREEGIELISTITRVKTVCK